MTEKIKLHTLLTLTLLTSLAQAEVNMKDGGYYKTWIDLEVPTPTYTFELRRSYHSRSLHRGIFGVGWCSDFEKSLEFRRNDQIVLRDCKLKTDILYERTSPSEYHSPKNPQEVLLLQDKIYLRKTPASLQKYNQNGQLISLSNHHGFHLHLQYGPQGSLQKIQINSFAEVVFKMDRQSRLIQSVSTVGSPLSKAKDASYQYAGANLASARNAWNGLFEYQYDDVQNLTRITYPDKSFETLSYDKEKDWILHIRTRDQCQESFAWTLVSTALAGKYKSSAKRSCRNQLISQRTFEFSRRGTIQGNKIRISSNRGNDAH